MGDDTLLKRLVDELDWKWATADLEYQKASKVVTGQQLTIAEKTWRRWIHGQIVGMPNSDACRILEHMFGYPAHQLLRPAPAGPLPVPPGAQQLAPDLKIEMEMCAQEAQQGANDASSAINDSSIDQVRADIDDLGRHYNSTAPYTVFQKARELRETLELWRERTQVPVQLQDITVQLGKTCMLLSQTAFDLGFLDQAAQMARTARVYGEASRFSPLLAFADGSLGTIAYFQQRPQEAVRHIQRAQTHPGVGDVGRRRLYAIEARAFAHLRDSDGSRRAVEQSLVVDTGTVDDLHQPVGEFGFPEARLNMSHATSMLLLRDPVQAERFAQQSLNLVSAMPAGEQSAPVRGGAAADLAMARLIAGDLDGAAAAIRTLLEVVTEQRVTGLLNRTHHVRRALTAPQFQGSQLATELGEQLEEFTRRSAPRQLGASPGLLAIGG
ncbi:DNA-binding protein [Streptacidiphilus sp. EB103A]|uniref:DNA-binding protein n=1 Tax=Streptacidiphilus sp. EB103A TaxID=3156275 RepID=UPI0035166198